MGKVRNSTSDINGQGKELHKIKTKTFYSQAFKKFADNYIKRKDRAFATPEQILEEAHEYFKWCEENPIFIAELHNKTGEIVDVPRRRAWTEGGFCLWAGITIRTWDKYKSNEGIYKEYYEVTKEIEQAIRDQKIDGASSGEFNANIISRLLGLTENRKVSVLMPDLTPEEKKKTEEVLEDYVNSL